MSSRPDFTRRLRYGGQTRLFLRRVKSKVVAKPAQMQLDGIYYFPIARSIFRQRDPTFNALQGRASLSVARAKPKTIAFARKWSVKVELDRYPSQEKDNRYLILRPQTWSFIVGLNFIDFRTNLIA